jgi:hypothetical protein
MREIRNRVSIREEVASRTLSKQTIVVHLTTGHSLSLDGVSSQIWQLLSEGKNLREICHIVTEEYEVSREEFERDLLQLIGELEVNGLVIVD